MLAQIIERVLRRCAPRAAPTEPAGLAVRKRLTRNRSRPVRLRYRVPIKVDRLVKASANMISPDIPPERQRRLEEPAAQRRDLAHDIAQVGGAWRGAASAAIRRSGHGLWKADGMVRLYRKDRLDKTYLAERSGPKRQVRRARPSGASSPSHGSPSDRIGWRAGWLRGHLVSDGCNSLNQNVSMAVAGAIASCVPPC